MRDLILPDPERTRSMLSALINFVKFALQQEQDLRKFRDHSVAALTERDRLAVEANELRRKIGGIQ
jgi:kinetochore protein Nuf2